jgi:hypothetical protein
LDLCGKRYAFRPTRVFSLVIVGFSLALETIVFRLAPAKRIVRTGCGIYLDHASFDLEYLLVAIRRKPAWNASSSRIVARARTRDVLDLPPGYSLESASEGRLEVVSAGMEQLNGVCVFRDLCVANGLEGAHETCSFPFIVRNTRSVS